MYSFDWDEKKNIANYKKHGIWFEEAQKVFYDLHLRVFFDDVHSKNNEDRFLALGFSEPQRLLIVSHTNKEDEEIIRIISARRATKNERGVYEERI